jgi:hypothetical protein
MAKKTDSPKQEPLGSLVKKKGRRVVVLYELPVLQVCARYASVEKVSFVVYLMSSLLSPLYQESACVAFLTAMSSLQGELPALPAG